MLRAVVIHQHTNNFGDDAAGSALVRGLLDVGNAESVDVYYIWHRNSGGLPEHSPAVRHHQLPLLAGNGDRRPYLAIMSAISMISPRLVTGDLRRLIASCKEADVTYVGPAGSNIGIYKDWMYLLSLVILVRAGIRPVFCQNTIADSSSKIFNRLARYVLKRSQVYVRELRSQAYLKSVGIHATLGVDTALLSPAPAASGGGDTYLTIVPTRLSNWHRDHRGFDDAFFLSVTLPEAVSEVARIHGLAVHVLAHLYGSEAESQLLEEFRGKLVAEGCEVVVVRPETFEGYSLDLAGASAVVSMRYHGLVLAGQAGTPCVALAYEHKMREAAGYLALDDLLIDVGKTSKGDIVRLLSQAVTEPEDLRQNLRTRADALRLIASGPILDVAALAVRGH